MVERSIRFSVVIPLYNKAPYVAKAIESVLNQTFREFEVIVVDDGSSDSSLEEARKFTDSRLKVITQQNAGVSTARNNGVQQAQYPYICFLDADDWWDSSFLAEIHQLIENHPNAGIYGTSYYIVKNGKNRIAPVGVSEGFKVGEIDYCQVYAKTLCMPLWTGAVCMPKAVFDEEKGFKPALKLGEDFDLWIRVALKHKVVFLNKPLAYYNQDVEVKWRAIGKVYPPEVQFAFNSDYLNDFAAKNEDVKHLLEIIKITCLRAYYLNKQYRRLAVSELEKIDTNRHKDATYAKYIKRPIWLTKTIDFMALIIKKIQSI